MAAAKYSKRQIADALRKSGGRITLACQYLEQAYGKAIHRSALYQRIANHPELAEVRDWAENRIVDIAENNIWRSVRSGNLKDSRYILNSLGRRRGYGVQRHEHSGPNGSPITSQVRPTPEQIEAMTDEQLDDLLNEHAAEG